MNPYLPLHYCIPDGEPRVFNDRVYIYGSNDIAGNMSYCSNSYRVFSASIKDLNNWTDHGVAFASKGPNDQVDWSDSELYAPDVIEKNGTYYLYFCLSDKSEGVATSKSPYGPFENAKRLYYPKDVRGGNPLSQIDPSVFIDDNSKVYYFFGQMKSQGLQLKDNMVEFEEGIYNPEVVDEQHHFFHEGSSIRKRNDIYYFVFCDTSTKRANTLSYATSKKPLGPYEYQGVIVNNFTCDPESWNNHGSILEINKQWYVFYHRSSNSSRYSRRACVEPIYFDENGKIKEVEMTSQGFEGSLNPYKQTLFAYSCGLFGTAYITQLDNDTHVVTDISDGDKIELKYFEFGEALKELNIKLRIYINDNKHKLNIILDDKQLLKTINMQEYEMNNWIDVIVPVGKIQGLHSLYFHFENAEGDESKNICILNWFKFF